MEIRKTTPEKLERVSLLNQVFSRDQGVNTVSRELQAMERPILVDFNGVLASNGHNLIPNPEGKQFLDGLRQIGDVIVATTASDWQYVNSHMREWGMWSDDIVLLTYKNWEHIDGHKASKPLAELFHKPFDIPLIDDSYFIVEREAPGTLPIMARQFAGSDEFIDPRSKDRAFGLGDALDVVRAHYENIWI